MSRVFVVHEPVRLNHDTGVVERTHDLSPAAEYGELVFLMQGRSPLTPQPVIYSLKQKLYGFNDDDYLLPIGHPALIGWATTIAASYNRGHVRMLIWESKIRKYILSDAWLYDKPEEQGEPYERRTGT